MTAAGGAAYGGGLWIDAVMGRTNSAGRVVSGPFTLPRGFRVRLDHTQARGL